MHTEREKKYFMKQALKQAHKAFERQEVPIGAVVIDHHNNIVARAYNQVEKKRVQTAHAEVLAIEKVCKKINDWRLNGYWIYVTLEPCTMCMGLIRLSRLAGVAYGLRSTLFGFQLDKEGIIQLYNKGINVEEGILADESSGLLKQFFKQKRSTK